MSLRPIFVGGLLVGCAEPPLPGVPAIDCSPADVTLAEAIAAVDQDADGVLTAEDLMPGEVAAVVRWSGSEGPSGRAVQVGPGEQVWPSPSIDWDPVWTAPVPMRCSPDTSAQVGFFAPDRGTDALSVGTAEVRDTTLSVIAYEMSEDEGTVEVDGTIALTAVSVERFSGHLDGTVSARLFRNLGAVPWDQTYTIEALAFRELRGTVSAP
ncbi:MAG: hypothetical protein AAF602_23065 [Myxococcota bacterium]